MEIIPWRTAESRGMELADDETGVGEGGQEQAGTQKGYRPCPLCESYDHARKERYA